MNGTRYSRDFLVYLAGPIAGLTYGEGQSWREYVTLNFPVEIRAISPLRAKAQQLARAGVLTKGGYEGHPLTSQIGITARDRFDCMRADAILVNLLGAKSISIGTCLELGWADAFRKPIVLVMEPGNLHEHAMVQGVAGFRTHNLDEGIEVMEAILMPEGRGTTRPLDGR